MLQGPLPSHALGKGGGGLLEVLCHGTRAALWQRWQMSLLLLSSCWNEICFVWLCYLCHGMLWAKHDWYAGMYRPPDSRCELRRGYCE